MDQPPAPRLSYAGPTTCLRCGHKFQSWDRRQNRLCPRCKHELDQEPSEELPHDLALQAQLGKNLRLATTTSLSRTYKGFRSRSQVLMVQRRTTIQP